MIQDLFALASQRICSQIMREGKNLGSGILKVSSFINHRVDVGLMDLCGHALADRFKDSGVTIVLTAQTSGVMPALAASRYLEKPMLFAREKKPITMAGGAYEVGG
jgi:xanthine phosphoribosyltransferase